MKVCIGGTFNIIHKGHKLLIDKAFQIAGKKGSVFIGIATGEIIKRKKDVKPYSERKNAIIQYISSKNKTTLVTIKPIKDKHGPSIDEDFDSIIASPETVETAEEINEKRREQGKKPLKIIQIPYVLSYDSKPISTTRIKNNEIDENGMKTE